MSNVNILGIDDNGSITRIKTNNSGSINVNISALQTWLEKNTIKYYRKNGDVYSASYADTLPGSGPNGANYTVLLNPSTNTKTFYIYNIKNSINYDSDGSISTVYFGFSTQSSIEATSPATGGSITNLDAYNTNTSGALLYPVIAVHLSNQQIFETYRIVDRGENLNIFNDYQEEYLEVPPGYGFYIRIDRGTTVDQHYSFNVRFIATQDEL